jgi:lipid II:glycine glycyltransferase (peptidoglycan interpeptide bridge formation enzyme)
MLREINDKTEWNKLREARTLPSGDFLQSWNWGEFQISLGRKVMRFAGDCSLVQIIELPLPLGKKYWFCPKGPVTNDELLTINDEFIDELKNTSKKAGAVFLRLEPAGEGFASAFMAKRSPHDINPRATSIVDLSKSEDELLAAMHSKTRYNIRVAEKHGVTVERYVDAAPVIDAVLGLFTETAARDKFNLHPLEYYKKQLGAFGEKKTFVPGVKSPHLLVFTAGIGGQMLAAAIIMFDKETVTYLHGASSNEMRNVMAPYALHWAIMKRAKERGYKNYDLWGISDDSKSGWAGITRFKRGWGGADVFAPGTFDLPVSRFWYSVYTLVRRIRG